MRPAQGRIVTVRLGLLQKPAATRRRAPGLAPARPGERNTPCMVLHQLMCSYAGCRRIPNAGPPKRTDLPRPGRPASLHGRAGPDNRTGFTPSTLSSHLSCFSETAGLAVAAMLERPAVAVCLRPNLPPPTRRRRISGTGLRGARSGPSCRQPVRAGCLVFLSSSNISSALPWSAVIKGTPPAASITGSRRAGQDRPRRPSSRRGSCRWPTMSPLAKLQRSSLGTCRYCSAAIIASAISAAFIHGRCSKGHHVARDFLPGFAVELAGAVAVPEVGHVAELLRFGAGLGDSGSSRTTRRRCPLMPAGDQEALRQFQVAVVLAACRRR